MAALDALASLLGSRAAATAPTQAVRLSLFDSAEDEAAAASRRSSSGGAGSHHPSPGGGGGGGGARASASPPARADNARLTAIMRDFEAPGKGPAAFARFLDEADPSPPAGAGQRADPLDGGSDGGEPADSGDADDDDDNGLLALMDAAVKQ